MVYMASNIKNDILEYFILELTSVYYMIKSEKFEQNFVDRSYCDTSDLWLYNLTSQ